MVQRHAEEAANFYVSLMPDSRILKVQRNVIDNPSGKAGSLLVVEFTLGGQRFVALNGGMHMEFTHAISLQINCADQAEVDRIWDAFLAHGGKAEQCGWLKDKFGLSWQIVPKIIGELMTGDPERANRVMKAVMPMKKLDLQKMKDAYDGK